MKIAEKARSVSSPVSDLGVKAMRNVTRKRERIQACTRPRSHGWTLGLRSIFTAQSRHAQSYSDGTREKRITRCQVSETISSRKPARFLKFDTYHTGQEERTRTATNDKVK
ncbi:hypothetical protein BaRGS_00014686 [Batillaria attramentaria]|uniref:Uncharacterized protein n=1 Tax=Batillaria attramentaria TaxID=370345 RepID=A0ABD0L491_9CAEN